MSENFQAKHSVHDWSQNVRNFSSKTLRARLKSKCLQFFKQNTPYTPEVKMAEIFQAKHTVHAWSQNGRKFSSKTHRTRLKSKYPILFKTHRTRLKWRNRQPLHELDNPCTKSTTLARNRQPVHEINNPNRSLPFVCTLCSSPRFVQVHA